MNAEQFYVKAAKLCLSFSPNLANYFRVCNGLLAVPQTRIGPVCSKSIATVYERELITNHSNSSPQHNCFKCGQLRTADTCRIRVKPKVKPSRTLLKFLKSNKKIITASTFVKNLYNSYFNQPCLYQITCKSCGYCTNNKGLRRTDAQYVALHNTLKKKRRLARKLKSKAESHNVKHPRLGSEVSPNVLRSSLESSSISSTSPTNVSLRTHNTSPMVAVTSANNKNLLTKSSVTVKTPSNKSKTILKKFNKQMVGDLIKSHSKKSKNQKKDSILSSFLSSL